jgi:acyl dehydratase
MTLELKYDRSLHEKEHKAGPFEITAEMIQAVNSSLGEQGPAFTSSDGAKDSGFRGMIAPPTLCSIFVREVQLPDVGIEFGRTQMHAGQRVQPIAPIYAGDHITASSHLKDVYAKTGRSGTMVFIVWETTFRNQDGDVVAEVQESFARRE